MKRRTVLISEVIVPLDIKRLKSGECLATSRVLRGLVAQGRTMAETIEIAQDVARKLIDSYLEHGDPLPSHLKKQFRRHEKISHLQIPVAVNS